MAGLLTQPTDASVTEFLTAIPDENRRRDCFALLEIMQSATGQPPVMWGANMVGFGQYHYRYASGHSGDYFWVGFSPRKQNLTLYILSGFAPFPELMANLGRYKATQSCLHLKRLSDVNLSQLRELITRGAAWMRATYPD